MQEKSHIGERGIGKREREADLGWRDCLRLVLPHYIHHCLVCAVCISHASMCVCIKASRTITTGIAKKAQKNRNVKRQQRMKYASTYSLYFIIIGIVCEVEQHIPTHSVSHCVHSVNQPATIYSILRATETLKRQNKAKNVKLNTTHDDDDDDLHLFRSRVDGWSCLLSKLIHSSFCWLVVVFHSGFNFTSPSSTSFHLDLLLHAAQPPSFNSLLGCALRTESKKIQVKLINQM